MTEATQTACVELVDKRAAERLVRQVEMAFGPLATRDHVVFGDNDRAILSHNFRLIVAAHRLAAIEATTEAAAKYLARKSEFLPSEASAYLNALAADLRAYKHLEPRHD